MKIYTYNDFIIFVTSLNVNTYLYDTKSLYVRCNKQAIRTSCLSSVRLSGVSRHDWGVTVTDLHQIWNTHSPYDTEKVFEEIP